MGDLPDPATSGAGHHDSTPHLDGGLVVDGASLVVGNRSQASEQQTPVQGQDHAAPKHAFSSQLDVASPPGSRSGPYNMGNLADALPQPGYRSGHSPAGAQQQYNPAASPPMMHQMQQIPQYNNHPSMQMANQGYYVQQPQMQQYYGASQLSPTQPQSSMPQRQHMAYYPNQMMMNPQPTYYYQPNHYQAQGQPMSNVMAGQYLGSSPTTTDPRTMSQSPDMGGMPQGQRRGLVGGQQNTVRGPPRKPRQSGHAIWIGNLPPQTDLMSLVYHVCKEAQGLESLFLISKSNCAFANFKDEPTCVAAQQKLHDSKFQGIRLVSRLRKSTVEGATGVTAPTGPAAAALSLPVLNGDGGTSSSDAGSSSPSASQPAQSRASPVVDGNSHQDKFFILKSLTVEDLELSVRTGIWATQSHNEEGINHAFKTFDNVYLIFSVNKSGEYFGYARMVSEINDDPEAAIEFAPKAQPTADLNLPKAIPTEAIDATPKGRIIDDSDRGTIFWEREREDGEDGEDDESDGLSTKSNGGEDGVKAWGKPFKLEWLSTNRLPFYRTRGLRNPWNSNREVKIARDGTELEPSVGRRLIGLFNRVQSPGPMPTAPLPQMNILPGYHQMRPYGQ